MSAPCSNTSGFSGSFELKGKMIDKRVVITGIGPLASTGIGREAFWAGILEKRVGIGLKEFKLNEELWKKKEKS